MRKTTTHQSSWTLVVPVILALVAVSTGTASADLEGTRSLTTAEMHHVVGTLTANKCCQAFVGSQYGCCNPCNEATWTCKLIDGWCSEQLWQPLGFHKCVNICSPLNCDTYCDTVHPCMVKTRNQPVVQWRCDPQYGDCSVDRDPPCGGRIECQPGSDYCP